jgi:DNA-binding transcriptional ArsR family regulator
VLAHIFAGKYLHIMEIRRDVFQAIADPTRRQIISLVAQQPLNLNSIAEKFDVTRQAVSLHVKILEECGLIMIKQQGRERYCEAKLQQLNEVAVWVEQYKQFWEQKFDALENYLDTIQNQKNKKNGSKKQRNKAKNK